MGKSGEGEPINYRIEKRIIDGQEVEVKVYPPSRRRGRQVGRVRGAKQRGALHVARERGLKEER